jgi:putative ATPase
MKNLGYGEEYQYDPDTQDGFSGANYFPDAMERRTFYEPTDHGYERHIRDRLTRWAQLRARKQRPQAPEARSDAHTPEGTPT